LLKLEHDEHDHTDPTTDVNSNGGRRAGKRGAKTTCRRLCEAVLQPSKVSGGRGLLHAEDLDVRLLGALVVLETSQQPDYLVRALEVLRGVAATEAGG
jgi:hypothetical protein